jgi:L-amino acid N-acyltransferase YncA
MHPSLLIRPSTPADLAAITAVYAWNVLNGTGTFELEPPDLAEMTRRRDDVLAKGLPWLVAEVDGSVRGYAYANHFRPRRAYRFCAAGAWAACCWPNCWRAARPPGRARCSP